jgi:hypothetical protein
MTMTWLEVWPRLHHVFRFNAMVNEVRYLVQHGIDSMALIVGVCPSLHLWWQDRLATLMTLAH